MADRVKTFLQSALENGRIWVQAISFEKGLVALSVDNKPGLARIDRFTRTDDYGSEEVPHAVAEAGAECWCWFSIGDDQLAVPLGTNLGAKVGVDMAEEGTMQ